MKSVDEKIHLFPGLDELTDEEVVERVRSGDTFLFEIIMRRYNQRLFRVTMAILKNDTEAEDVMQDAYVRAYTHLNQFAGQAKFSTWLTKIAVHESLARVRSQKRVTSIEEIAYKEGSMGSMITQTGDPQKELLRRRMVELMENAVSILPCKYRLVIMMRDVQGLNTHETAECLGISEESVRTRLHRARALLKKTLETRAGMTLKDLHPFDGKPCDRVVERVMKRIT